MRWRVGRDAGEWRVVLDELDELFGGEVAKPGPRLSECCGWRGGHAVCRVKEQFIQVSHEDGGDAVVDLPEAHDRAGRAGLEESCGESGELVGEACGGVVP